MIKSDVKSELTESSDRKSNRNLYARIATNELARMPTNESPITGKQSIK